jgi:2'-5' RNA ligase
VHFNYFLAALLDDKTKNECLHYALDPTVHPVRSTTPAENLHITVGYIGPLELTLLPIVCKAWKSLTQENSARLAFEHIDAFGYHFNWHKYLGIAIQDPYGDLHHLRQRAQALLEQVGLTFREPELFHPHVTIQHLKEPLKPLKVVRAHTFQVTHLGLWYRDPTAGHYKSKCDFRLKGAKE